MIAKPSNRKSQGQRDLEAWTKELRSGGAGLTIEIRESERFQVDAKTIRKALRLTRQEFASKFGLSLRTVENWETGTREPEGPARSYLVAIAFAHEAIERAFRDYRNGMLPEQPAPAPGKHRGSETSTKIAMEAGIQAGAGRKPRMDTIGLLVPIHDQLSHFIRAVEGVVAHPGSKSDRIELERALRQVRSPVVGATSAAEGR
jgi:transcriptional regulator with XRE-family HTH domain